MDKINGVITFGQKLEYIKVQVIITLAPGRKANEEVVKTRCPEDLTSIGTGGACPYRAAVPCAMATASSNTSPQQTDLRFNIH
jgi:hypothetical protein